jgi:putative SOS response-associated peptidase YedK
MCYSALVLQKAKDLGLRYYARVQTDMIEEYIRRRLNGEDVKVALGFDYEWIKSAETPAEKEIAKLIKECHKQQIGQFETEMFKQKKRLNEAEKKLAVKTTKVSENDKRIATNKISSLLGKIEVIQKLKLIEANYRIYPKMFSPLVVEEDGKRSVILARYGIRPSNETEEFDKKYDGAYNARRDNLLKVKFWKDLLGKNHCILPIQRFYENVNQNGRNIVLEFAPKEGGEIILPGLWDTWGKGKDRLDTFAVITDDPNPEVSAAGHDRTPIPMKDENIDLWLSPESKEPKEWTEFLKDKRSFYFQHSKVA